MKNISALVSRPLFEEASNNQIITNVIYGESTKVFNIIEQYKTPFTTNERYMVSPTISFDHQCAIPSSNQIKRDFVYRG